MCNDATLYCDSVGFVEYVPLMYYFVLWFCWICWVCTTDVLLCTVILLDLLSMYHWCTTLYCDSVGFVEYVPLMYYFVLWFCWICWVCTTDVLLCSVILLDLLSVYHFCATLDLHWTCSSVCHSIPRESIYSPAAISAHWTYRTHFQLCHTRYLFSPQLSDVFQGEEPCSRTQQCPKIEKGEKWYFYTTLYCDFALFVQYVPLLYYFVLWFCSICSVCATSIILWTVLFLYLFSMYHCYITLYCNFALFFQYLPPMYYFVL